MFVHRHPNQAFSIANNGNHIQHRCVPKWTGQCGNGEARRIFRDTAKHYTVEECHKICASNTLCDSFSVGINGARRCVIFKSGCTQNFPSSWTSEPSSWTAQQFFLSDCGNFDKNRE